MVGAATKISGTIPENKAGCVGMSPTVVFFVGCWDLCGLGRREMMQMRYAQILGRRVPWLLEGSDVRKACQEDAFGGKSISTAISKLANMLRHSKSY